VRAPTRHSSSQLTLHGAGCDRQWIEWDGVRPTARTGRPLCSSHPQQMLVQMPRTLMSLTILIASTLQRPEMALGQRPGNSVAAILYTHLTLHNISRMLCRIISAIQFDSLHTECRSTKFNLRWHSYVTCCFPPHCIASLNKM